MATPNNIMLCNGIPIDHRLKRFLPSAKLKHSQQVGTHVEIIESFGKTMIRDDKSYPSKYEAKFAAWLAKPDLQGGVVIALLQPAKTQVYTPDFQKVKDECLSLVYLEEALSFLNGPGGIATTSVFDAFPFILEPISPTKLSREATASYNTFYAMLEAKRPEVVFTCWRVKGQELLFSGQGLGNVHKIEQVTLSNGHVVRLVNGFHPSYMINFNASESCFRRLFIMELCNAFSKLNGTWQEEPWMSVLRYKCTRRRHELMEENASDGVQPKIEVGRVLRGPREDALIRKREAFADSFDKGLQRIEKLFDHIASQTYRSGSSWDLYRFFVFEQDMSEGICNALLAIAEANKRFEPATISPDSSLVDLSNHIGQRSFAFVKEYIPSLLQRPKVLDKTLWSTQLTFSTSRGFKRSMENVTIKFYENLAVSFSEPSKSWTYTPELLYNAFKDFAIVFEECLGMEYEAHLVPKTAKPSNILNEIMPPMLTLSLKESLETHPLGSVSSRTNVGTSSSITCYNCGERGHYSPDCAKPKKKSVVSPQSNLRPTCYKCGNPGHYANKCMAPKKEINYPSKLSLTSACYNCKQLGHYSSDCTNPKIQRTCYKCGEAGHFANACAT